MKTHGNEAPYLPLLIGGAAVILLGTSGIAAVMPRMPSSTDVAGVVFTLDEHLTPLAGPVDAETQIPPARPQGDASARVKCAECGGVESIREIEQLGEGIDAGAAGGAASGGRNEIPGKSTKSYEVTIRMKDGSIRVFMATNAKNWRSGERVIFIEGVSQKDG